MPGRQTLSRAGAGAVSPTADSTRRLSDGSVLRADPSRPNRAAGGPLTLTKSVTDAAARAGYARVTFHVEHHGPDRRSGRSGPPRRPGVPSPHSSHSPQPTARMPSQAPAERSARAGIEAPLSPNTRVSDLPQRSPVRRARASYGRRDAGTRAAVTGARPVVMHAMQPHRRPSRPGAPLRVEIPRVDSSAWPRTPLALPQDRRTQSGFRGWFASRPHVPRGTSAGDIRVAATGARQPCSPERTSAPPIAHAFR